MVGRKQGPPRKRDKSRPAVKKQGKNPCFTDSILFAPRTRPAPCQTLCREHRLAHGAEDVLICTSPADQRSFSHTAPAFPADRVKRVNRSRPSCNLKSGLMQRNMSHIDQFSPHAAQNSNTVFPDIPQTTKSSSCRFCYIHSLLLPGIYMPSFFFATIPSSPICFVMSKKSLPFCSR